MGSPQKLRRWANDHRRWLTIALVLLAGLAVAARAGLGPSQTAQLEGIQPLSGHSYVANLKGPKSPWSRMFATRARRQQRAAHHIGIAVARRRQAPGPPARRPRRHSRKRRRAILALGSSRIDHLPLRFGQLEPTHQRSRLCRKLSALLARFVFRRCSAGCVAVVDCALPDRHQALRFPNGCGAVSDYGSGEPRAENASDQDVRFQPALGRDPVDHGAGSDRGGGHGLARDLCPGKQRHRYRIHPSSSTATMS